MANDGVERASITIDAPIEVVWSVFTDVERWPTWASSFTSVELIDGPMRLGAKARIRQRALLSTDILPGVIHCEHGWWFPERADPEHGAFESNANVLTSQSPPYDPAMGTYQLRGLLCRIGKAAA